MSRPTCRYDGNNRGWCVKHDAEWRIDRAVCAAMLARQCEKCGRKRPCVVHEWWHER